MLSHQIGTGQRADLKRLTEVVRDLQKLQRVFEAAQSLHRRQLEDREQRIAELERELAESNRLCRDLSTTESQLSHELHALGATSTQRHVGAVSANLAARECEVVTLQKQKATLESALAAAHEEISGLRSENTELTAECAAIEHHTAQSLGVC